MRRSSRPARSQASERLKQRRPGTDRLQGLPPLSAITRLSGAEQGGKALVEALIPLVLRLAAATVGTPLVQGGAAAAGAATRAGEATADLSLCNGRPFCDDQNRQVARSCALLLWVDPENSPSYWARMSMPFSV